MQNIHRYKTKNRTKLETVLLENETFNADIAVKAYCAKVQELYEKFCDCYATEQVTTVIDDQLSRMYANKISVKGNLFFVINRYLPLLTKGLYTDEVAFRVLSSISMIES